MNILNILFQHYRQWRSIVAKQYCFEIYAAFLHISLSLTLCCVRVLYCERTRRPILKCAGCIQRKLPLISILHYVAKLKTVYEMKRKPSRMHAKRNSHISQVSGVCFSQVSIRPMIPEFPFFPSSSHTLFHFRKIIKRISKSVGTNLLSYSAVSCGCANSAASLFVSINEKNGRMRRRVVIVAILWFIYYWPLGSILLRRQTYHNVNMLNAIQNGTEWARHGYE